MTTSLPHFSRAGFQLSTVESAEGLELSFTGVADMHVIEALGAFLGAVHSAAVERKAPRVVVDFGKLEFMNSSCFNSFVSWIGQVQDAPSSLRYQIEFRSNPQMHWQRRSLNALRCFGEGVVSIAT